MRYIRQFENVTVGCELNSGSNILKQISCYFEINEY